MKILSIITLLAVLVSCGGSSGGGSNPGGGIIDPVTVDMFEESIRSLSAGMVTNKTSTGTIYNISSNNGTYSGTIEANNYTEKEIVLKVQGDSIYTLVEQDYEDVNTEDERHVRRESIDQLVRQFSDPLPTGFSFSISGNTFTLTGVSNDEWQLDTNAAIRDNLQMIFKISLDDIRCSERSTMSNNAVLTQNGNSQALPPTGSSSVTGCGTTLTATQLRALNLTSITYCDETNPDINLSCVDNVNLSHLVQ